MVFYLLDGGAVFAELWNYHVDMGLHEILKLLDLSAYFFSAISLLSGKSQKFLSKTNTCVVHGMAIEQAQRSSR